MVVFAKKDQSKALEFISMMRQVTPAMGIGVKDPHMIELRDDRTETYLRSIRENLHPRVQMVVIIFPTSRDDRYAAVKKLCCVESPVPSQVFLQALMLKNYCIFLWVALIKMTCDANASPCTSVLPNALVFCLSPSVTTCEYVSV